MRKLYFLLAIGFCFNLLISSCNEKEEDEKKEENEVSSINLVNNSIDFTISKFQLGAIDYETSDEFNDNEIDTSKWDVADTFWWSNDPDNFVRDKNNVQINTETGCLELFHNHNGRKFTGSWIRSKKRYTEGFFEAKCKMSHGAATNSAFWIFDGYTTHDTYDEIDVVETANLDLDGGQKFSTNYHLNNNDSNINYQAYPAQKLNDKKFTHEYHTFALKLTKDEIIWYWNNEEIRREKNVLHGTPMNVHLSTAWFTHVTEELSEYNLPHIMSVDYIRVFELKE